MSNGFYNVPKAVNEPVKGYALGSPERTELLAEYKRMYNTTVDVPMYIKKAKNEKHIKKRDVETGINELKSCSAVTQKMEFWRHEIPWLSGYFTFGVWSSIALFIWNKRFLKLG